MFDFLPPSVAFAIGPINVYFYGLCYAIGLTLAAYVIHREASWRRLAVDELPNGFILVAVAALVGGRLYHVIDQWALYQDDLLRIVLPPYTGLGAFGGLITGTITGILYARWRRQPVLAWADAIAPGIFAMQAVARWGNWFNQELYGPPTNLPWGIAISCAKRVAEYACRPGQPLSLAGTSGTTPVDAHFQPMFLYESLSGLLGMLALIWIGRRFAARLRQGDLLLIFFVWYGAVRFVLENLRAGYNWTVFGIPTAQLVSGGFIVLGLVLLAWRHRPGSAARRADEPPAVEPPDNGFSPA